MQHTMGEMIANSELSRCKGLVEDLFEAISHFLNAANAGGPRSAECRADAERLAAGVRAACVGKRVIGHGTSDASINRSLGVVEAFDMASFRFVVKFKVELSEQPPRVEVAHQQYHDGIYRGQARALNPVRRARLKYINFQLIGPQMVDLLVQIGGEH